MQLHVLPQDTLFCLCWKSHSASFILPEEADSNIPGDDPLAVLELCVVVKTGVVLLAGGICGLLLESELLLHHPRHTCVVLLQEGVLGHLSLDLLLSEIAVVYLLAVLPTALPHRRTLHHVDCAPSRGTLQQCLRTQMPNSKTYVLPIRAC